MRLMLNKLKIKYHSLPKQLKASFWFLVCSFLQRGISFITTPVFTRLLTNEEYGTYNVFSSWLSILTVFVTLNLSAGVYTQGLVKLDSEKDRAIFSSSLQGLTLVMAICWTTVYLCAPEFWNDLLSLTTIQILAILCIIWTTAAFNFWASEQRVKLNYRILVVVSMCFAVMQPLLGIVLVLKSEDKVTARIIGYAISCIILYIWLFFAQVKKGKQLVSGRYWKYALMFNLPLVPHYLSQTVLNSADRIMIDRMVGSAEAGIYSLAYSIANIMFLFNTALLQTINPWIYQKIKAGEVEHISGIAYVSLIGIGVINLLLIMFAPELVRIFAPASYYDAIWVIPPIALSVYFIFSYSLFADFEFYYKNTVFIMIASICGAVLNIILNYIFIRLFGYKAAGFTTLICYIVYAAAHYICMQRICKKNLPGIKVYSTKKLIILSACFVIAGLLLTIIYNNVLVRYGVIIMFVIVCILKRDLIIQSIRSIYHIKRKQI